MNIINVSDCFCYGGMSARKQLLTQSNRIKSQRQQRWLYNDHCFILICPFQLVIIVIMIIMVILKHPVRACNVCDVCAISYFIVDLTAIKILFVAWINVENVQ